MRVPDAYDDIFRICRKVNPVAALDIGAHIGETVMNLAEEFPALPIHGFEPTPKTFDILQQRTARLANVTVHQAAVGDRDGTMSFFVNREGQTNSLLDNDRGNFESLGTLVEHVEKIDVKVIALDDWLAKNVPDGGKLFVKADIQGAEGLMLDGGRRAFSERVAALYCEVSFAPLYKGQEDFRALYGRLTDEFGFVLFDIYPCGRDNTGRAGWADALWVKPADVLPLT
jgi:FkbM family methyltransferase